METVGARFRVAITIHAYLTDLLPRRYAPEFVELVALELGAMLAGVALAAYGAEVVEAERDMCRGDVLGRKRFDMVDDLGGRVPADRETIFA